MRCDICGSPDFVGVASVPAFPVSLAWCKWCIAVSAYPLWCAEALMCIDNDGYGDIFTLGETIEKYGLTTIKAQVAGWFLESVFWVPPEEGTEGPGWYMRLTDYLDRLEAINKCPL
jgi:hypothetical protein